MVRIVKPAWVEHLAEKKDRCPIYTLSVHPDGSRLATGSMDKKVKIWSTVPIIDAKAAENESNPKLLCTMSEHTGTVLTVRWAHHGRFLASGGDDAVGLIWAISSDGGGRLWGSDEVNVENWKPYKRLVGHLADIIDMAWSPDDSMLASVGLDSTVRIWDGMTFEPIVRLDAHGGFVKGVCWDPVGEFLATQSDDKTVKIWSTQTWQCVHTVSKPFAESGIATFFRRLSWSPDGTFIAASNAKNGPVFVGQVIIRPDWTEEISFVGHANTIQVASFSPRLFFAEGEDRSRAAASTILALGGDDFTLSIWKNTRHKPLVVFTDLFGREILDLGWSRDGLTLYGCSQDGTICAITFDEPELPGRGDDADTKRVLEESYSFKPSRAARTLPAIEAGNGFPVAPAGQAHLGAATTSTAVNVIQPRKKKAGDSRKLTTYLKQADERNSNPLAQIASSSRSSTGLQPPQPRLQPVPPPAIPNVSEAASAFADAPLQPLDTPSQAQASRDRMFQDAPNQVFARDREDIESPRLGSKRKSSVHAEERVPKGRTMGASRPNTDVKEIRAPRAGPSSYPAAGSSTNAVGSMPLLPLPAVQSVVRALLDDTAYIEATNAEDSKGKNKVVYSLGGQNMWMDYVGGAVLGLVVTKMFAAAGCEDGMVVAYSPAGRRLFGAHLGAPIVEMAAKTSMLACITAHGELHVLDTRHGGKAVHSPIRVAHLLQETAITGSVASVEHLQVRSNGVAVLITSHPSAYIYDASKSAFTPLLTPHQLSGSPLISSIPNSSSERSDRGGRQRGGASGPSGPVSAIESLVVESWRKAQHDMQNDLPQSQPRASEDIKPEWWDVAMTLQHLDMRMRACELLESKEEYKAAMKAYAQIIGQEGFRGRAEELAKDMMGPLYQHAERSNRWQSEIAGLAKRDILRMILGIFSTHPALSAFAQQQQAILKAVTEEEKALREKWD